MKAFTTWTVLRHEPIEKHGPSFWTVRGSLPDPKLMRVMSLARLEDGRLLVHNAVALEEPAMKELEAFGKVAFLVVPNGHHRLDARIWKDRFPEAKVLCPKGQRKKVEEVVPVDLTYDQFTGDGRVKLRHLAGLKDREGVLEVQEDGATFLVFNDMLMNQKKLPGVAGFMLHPTGTFSVPRAMRLLFVSDKRAFADDLRALAERPGLKRIVVSHGKAVSEGCSDALRTAAARL